MDFKKGWIILDSITYISCHMYRRRRKFLCIAYSFCTRARGDFKGTGHVFPNSVTHGSNGKRERDPMGKGDDLLGSPIAIPAAIKTNRSLFLLCKCIKSFPLGLRRNAQTCTERNRTEIPSLQGKEFMAGGKGPGG